MGWTDWRLTALDDLVRVDRHRKRRGQRPIGLALYQAVCAHLAGYPEPMLPGKPISHPDLPPGNFRLTRIRVGRTGGPYRVIFQYDARDSRYEVLRVIHPRENAGRDLTT